TDPDHGRPTPSGPHHGPAPQDLEQVPRRGRIQHPSTLGLPLGGWVGSCTCGRHLSGRGPSVGNRIRNAAPARLACRSEERNHCIMTNNSPRHWTGRRSNPGLVKFWAIFFGSLLVATALIVWSTQAEATNLNPNDPATYEGGEH